MFPPLLQQIKKRRLALGLKQKDMPSRTGIARQQYQRLEMQGNPRLETLELIAKGLNSEIMLIPQEKRMAVQAILEAEHIPPKALSDDPWQGLLEDSHE